MRNFCWASRAWIMMSHVSTGKHAGWQNQKNHG